MQLGSYFYLQWNFQGEWSQILSEKLQNFWRFSWNVLFCLGRARAEKGVGQSGTPVLTQIEGNGKPFSRAPHPIIKMVLMTGRIFLCVCVCVISTYYLEHWNFIQNGFIIRVGGSYFLSFLCKRWYSSNVILETAPSVSIHFNFSSSLRSVEREEVLRHLQTIG